jgi:hypothetical protein
LARAAGTALRPRAAAAAAAAGGPAAGDEERDDAADDEEAEEEEEDERNGRGDGAFILVALFAPNSLKNWLIVLGARLWGAGVWRGLPRSTAATVATA